MRFTIGLLVMVICGSAFGETITLSKDNLYVRGRHTGWIEVENNCFENNFSMPWFELLDTSNFQFQVSVHNLDNIIHDDTYVEFGDITAGILLSGTQKFKYISSNQVMEVINPVYTVLPEPATLSLAILAGVFILRRK